MKTFKSILILSLVSNLIFGFSQSIELPKSWFNSGSKPDSYKVGIDSIVFQKGHKSAIIESLGFDNMQDRPITGNSEWTKCEIIMDVPVESVTLNFGALISGTGKIWFDNVSFEILDNATPKISADPITLPIPEKPVNLDFEE